MALTLPQNFKNDLQTRDTALVPAIVINPEGIGNYITISTNVLSLNWASDGGVLGNILNFSPILLNVPSLKESIDIEKRNYKISSINIDISNLLSIIS